MSCHNSRDIHVVLTTGREAMVPNFVSDGSNGIVYLINLNKSYEYMPFQEISFLTSNNLDTVRDWVAKAGLKKVGSNAVFRDEFKEFWDYFNAAKQSGPLPCESKKKQTDRLLREWPLMRDNAKAHCEL